MYCFPIVNVNKAYSYNRLPDLLPGIFRCISSRERAELPVKSFSRIFGLFFFNVSLSTEVRLHEIVSSVRHANTRAHTGSID